MLSKGVHLRRFKEILLDIFIDKNVLNSLESF